MAVAQGQCPSCGAPIEFGVGSSIAKICEFCRATVMRSDRGLQNLGQVAEIANTPSLIAVGDQGTLSGRQFEVLGRVQLDHGKGPWDEYYVSFDYGQQWGWLAYAQGHWYVTTHAPGLAIPPFNALTVELDVALGNTFVRVAEIKTGRIVSGEGELPGAFPPGYVRHYADCYGPQNAFATLDYGDNSGAYTVFMGWVFDEPQMQITQFGQRHVHKVKTTSITCPSCGGEIPKLSGDRGERVGCPYCHAVSDIATQQVIAQQEAAMKAPDIPIGSHGTFDGVQYICIAYVRRGTDFDDEHYSWEEYLIWSERVGYRWLVKDPETGWLWVNPVNLAELGLGGMPDGVAWGDKQFQIRNRGQATVEYVLGEVYWKCEVGETTRTADFVNGRDVLSREESPGEAHWSYSSPVPWAALAQGFNLDPNGPGAQLGAAGGAAAAAGGSGKSGCSTPVVLILLILIVLMICMLAACGSCGGAGSGSSSSGYRGGGYYGGK